MADRKTTQEVEVKGVPEAIRAYEALRAAREAAAGVSPGIGGAGSGGGSAPSAPASSSSTGGLPGYTGTAAAMAPPAPGTTRSPGGTTQTVTSSYGGQGGGLPSYISVATMTIVATTVILQATSLQMPGGGGYSGPQPPPAASGSPVAPPGPFGAGGGSVGAGAGGGGAAAPPAPASPGGSSGGAPPWSPVGNPPEGASWGRFFNNIAQRPTLGGVAGALINEMPIAPVAIASAISSVATAGANAYYASDQSQFSLQNDLMIRRMSGEYVPPSVAALMKAKAADADRWAVTEQIGIKPFEGIPIVGPAYRAFSQYAYRDEESRQAYLQGRINQEQSRREIYSLGLGSTTTGDPENAKLGYLIGSDSLALGRNSARRGLGRDYNAQRRAGALDPDIASAYSLLNQAAGEPGNDQLYDVLHSYNKSIQSEDLMRLFAGNGNRGALAALYRARLLTPGQFDQGIETARRVEVSRTQMAIGQANLGTAESGISLMQTNGASSGQIAAATEATGALYAPMLAAIDTQMAASTNEYQRSQLRSQRAQIVAAQSSAGYQGMMIRYQGRQQVIGARTSLDQTATEAAMYGMSESAVSAGFARQAGDQNAQADIYAEMSQNRRFSPEQRQQYYAQSVASRFQARYGIARQEGQFRYGLRMGEAGIAQAENSQQDSRAALFGGIQDIYQNRANDYEVLSREAGIVRGQLAGQYGPQTQGERLQSQQRLIQLITQETEVRETAARSLATMNVQLAQTNEGLAVGAQSRAQMLGIGGVRGFGFAQSAYEAAAGVSRQADARVAMLRARGVAEDNPEMQAAVAAADQARTSALGRDLATANVPFSLGLQREESATNYQISILSGLPGTYGNLRGAYQRRYEGAEHKAAELRARYEADKKANAGRRSREEQEAVDFAYQRQMQEVGQEQAQAYSELSTGWESRMINSAMNTPGSFSFISPMFSNAAAIRNGVRNPMLGASGADVPMFLQQAGRFNSIAGATGTGEGFGVTAMTGAMPISVVSNPSVNVTAVFNLADGSQMKMSPVQTTVHSNRQDTSPAAQGEQLRKMGVSNGTQRG